MHERKIKRCTEVDYWNTKEEIIKNKVHKKFKLK